MFNQEFVYDATEEQFTPLLDGTTVTRIIGELTSRWQSFGNENDTGRRAVQRLVMSGFAQQKLSYTVRHPSGECIRIRGVFCGDCWSESGFKKTLQFLSWHCKESWFRDEFSELEIHADDHDYCVSISSHAEHWRKLMNDLQMVEWVRHTNLMGNAIKDGVETWQEQRRGFDADWPTVTESAETMCVNKGRIDKLVKDGQLKDNGKTQTDRRIDPASILRYAKVAGIVLNDRDQ